MYRPPNRKQIDDLEGFMIEQVRDVLRDAEERVRAPSQQEVESKYCLIDLKVVPNPISFYM